LLTQPRGVRLLQQRLAGPLLRDLVDVRENAVEGTIGGDELLRRLFTDAAYTRDIVRGVPDECEVVRHESRRNTQTLAAVLHPDPLLLHARRSATPWIQEPHTGSNELLKILVTRNDDDIHASVDRSVGESSNHVIGFVAADCDDRNVIRIEELADTLHTPIEVRLKLLGELFPRCLVRCVGLVPEGEAGVVHPSQVLGLVVGEQTVEKVYDSPRGGRVLAVTRRQRPRDEREERPIDEGITVNEKQPWCGRGSDDA